MEPFEDGVAGADAWDVVDVTPDEDLIDDVPVVGRVELASWGAFDEEAFVCWHSFKADVHEVTV